MILYLRITDGSAGTQGLEGPFEQEISQSRQISRHTRALAAALEPT